MLSTEKSALLQAFLGGLPQAAAARLAKAVEIDRLAGGTVLPHDMILGALRPKLRHVERTPTPLRLFCKPFEDLVRPRTRQRTGKRKSKAASRAPASSRCGRGCAGRCCPRPLPPISPRSGR